ncbi:SagB/ThcOx family dehydrogenase [Hydrogenophaga sp. PAMC20947]|uniref:SagB/ThcOx family dehydrogenase n=1 Tax=Hydrogenophaga sp. PAMC20947 TaxID=2565558 RepID=UPI00109D9FF7|nr:SagB/ThcOx family dehydrogenase [Hydrogenophaga sp. PAMC20947]QCB45386.1 SagB/ThcOx family dehydrogenase [Hydrogenophaga sp. PAMC20947]
MDDVSRIETVMRYHERTKHHFNRYAPGPGELDWANQPNPFRRFEGAPLVRLPLLGPDDEPKSPQYEDLYRRGVVPSMPLTVRSLSRLLQYGLGLSAWKQAGTTRWALRCNPSSGNLHPTEGYLLIGALPELSDTPGLYHYAPREHGIERRVDCSADLFTALMGEFPAQTVLLGLSSIHWREAWKYGERAFRYCQHDAGHAIGALRIAAATLGWSASLLDGLADETINDLLGLSRAEDFEGVEREHAVAVLAVWPTHVGERRQACAQRAVPRHLDSALVQDLTRAGWHGAANRLSRDEPVRWEGIEKVAAATLKPTGDAPGFETFELPGAEHNGLASEGGPQAGQIILQRRSLQACDGQTAITATSFYRILTRLMPLVELPASRRPMPWDTMAEDSNIQLGLFVHRVTGLEPGLYLLVRDPTKIGNLKRAMNPDFDWSTPPGCPAELLLRMLKAGDARRLATQLSCHQDIAGDGVFSLAMIAQYQEPLFTHGAWFYRRLLWEAGLIGQVLYLESEAAGVQATGIGCYFDDPVHRMFGIEDLAYQSLYHFTVGVAIEDLRLTTLAPYGTGADRQERGIDRP